MRCSDVEHSRFNSGQGVEQRVIWNSLSLVDPSLYLPTSHHAMLKGLGDHLDIVIAFSLSFICNRCTEVEYREYLALQVGLI